MASFIEQENRDLQDPTEPRYHKPKTWRSIFCTKLAKGIIVALAIAVIVPTLAYFFIISRNVPEPDDSEQFYCLIVEEFRIPCGNAGIGKDECETANCCFNTTTKQCHHYLPSKFFYRKNDDSSIQPSQEESPVGSTIRDIKLTIQNKTANKISLIIHDPAENVQEIALENTNYSISLGPKKLSVNVYDQEGDKIFSSTKGALIASDQYWEWGFELSNGTLFGLDQNRIELEGNATLTKVIYKNWNDHYTMPVLWAYQAGKFHGISIRHDGPLEIQILASNMMILRSLLGKKVEVELTLGPTPIDLYNNQFENLTPPPLWAMGTHNCRKGDTTVLKEILDIYAANAASSFDTDCVHQNLFMSLQDASNQQDIVALQAVLADLETNNQKFLFALPPHILLDETNQLYEKAKELNVLYKNQSGVVYNGTYLNKIVVYPDFTSDNIGEFVNSLFDWLDSSVGLAAISGFILNDNWPQDDSYSVVDHKSFPYFSEALNKQMQFTIPWNLEGTDQVLHLEKHNLYGEYQNASLGPYLPENSLIISASKMYGNAEPEISDNFDASWENFRLYLNRVVFSSISGNPMVGLPICGDTTSYNKTLHEMLCIRWYLAAATMPYFRVSSGDAFRDPANLNSASAQKIAESAMTRRGLLQDYLYTSLTYDAPVIRPMYFDYYENESTLSIERQYTIGSSIIVAHPFSSGSTRLQVFLPSSKGVWYEFWGGTMFTPLKGHEYVDIDLLESDLVMFVAQGNVVPLASGNDIHLYVGLNCTSDCVAEGKLLKDDYLLEFSATDTAVVVAGLPVNDCNFALVYLRLYGYTSSESYIRTYSLESEVLCANGSETVTIPFNDL